MAKGKDKQVNHDLFSGKTDFSLCFRELYKQLMSGEDVSFAGVFYPVYKEKYGKEFSRKKGLTNDPLYTSLKKAVDHMKTALSEASGESPENFWQSDGKRKGTTFRYTGENRDPLAHLRNAAVIKNISRYVQFCLDTEGLIPREWSDYFLKGTMDLLDIKKKREQLDIKAEIRNQRNLKLLPVLYEAIAQRTVLSFLYKEFTADEPVELTFHPQYLREYNGRWHVFGEADGMPRYTVSPLSLDRIESEIVRRPDVAYHDAPEGRYRDFFAPVVGVTRRDLIDPRAPEPHIYTVRVRALTRTVDGLMRTKPLHDSEPIVAWGEHDDGTYSEFELHAMMNYELMGSLLQLGAEARVVGDEKVVEYMSQLTARIADLYK